MNARYQGSTRMTSMEDAVINFYLQSGIVLFLASRALFMEIVDDEMLEKESCARFAIQ